MPVVSPLIDVVLVPVETLQPGDLFHLTSEHAYARPLAIAFQAGPERIGGLHLEGEKQFTLNPITRNAGHHAIRHPVTELVIRLGTARHDTERMWHGGTLFLTPEEPQVLIASKDNFGDPRYSFLSLKTWQVTGDYPTRYACFTDWALLDRTARGDDLIVQVGDPG